MKIVSSYRVAITRCDIKLDETVKIYRNMLAALIPVVDRHWAEIAAIESGALSQQQYVEHLVHGTNKQAALYPEFDRNFYKYPSYLRRKTITDAIGAVSSYRSLLKNWEAGGRKGKAPSLQAERVACPAFFRDNMYSVVEDETLVLAPTMPKFKRELLNMGKTFQVNLKVYHNNDWVWVTASLRKTDVKYLLKYWTHVKACAPCLEKRYGKYYLRFAFEESVPLSDFPIGEQTICAVDLGLNTDAVCSIMTADGTILARKFVNFASEKDHLYHVLNRIKRFQREHNSRDAKSFWSFAKRVNDELAIKIATAIVDFAVLHSVSCIVFEHLDFRGKRAKGRSKRQKITMWRKCGIQDYVTHKAHRCGIRISRICAWGTSALAFDGSGKLTRDEKNHALATFKSGKRYNADLSASYNIGARYFIREITKSLAARLRSQLQAKVPDSERRTSCTLATLRSFAAEFNNLLQQAEQPA